MIPKIIHYCWLSQQRVPPEIMECINTWHAKFPDYEFILWDSKRFDLTSNRFVAEACRAKKWAFAADYIRIYALFQHGGIYLDSDVFVKKRFDEFLHHDFFSAMEYHHQYAAAQGSLDLINEDGSPKTPYLPKPGIGMQAAILGSIKGHPFLRDCLNWYRNKSFILEDGSFNSALLAPSVLAMVAENYGFRYLDTRQELKENMLILPSTVFAGALEYETDASYAVHCCAGSWRDIPKESVYRRIQAVVKRLLGNY